MLIKPGLTAICFVASLALFASSGFADHHHGKEKTQHDGVMKQGGMMGRNGMMDRRKMMRRHMRSESRAERRRDGRGFHHRVRPISHLTIEDVRHQFEHRVALRGNKRLKVGEVKQIDDNTITADIVTVDDSLVRRLRVDLHSGRVTLEE